MKADINHSYQAQSQNHRYVGSTHAVATAGASGILYTCSMHPEVVRDAPGHCPKCGMTLIPLRE